MAILLNPKKSKKTPKVYPVAAIRDGVIFPHVEVVLTFGRSKSIKAIKESFASNREIIFVTQKKASVTDPKKSDLYQVGVLAKIERTLKTNEEINALIRGSQRVKLQNLDDTGSYLKAKAIPIPDVIQESAQTDALSRHLLNTFKKIR